jgi:hypothetical protein
MDGTAALSKRPGGAERTGVDGGEALGRRSLGAPAPPELETVTDRPDTTPPSLAPVGHLPSPAAACVLEVLGSTVQPLLGLVPDGSVEGQQTLKIGRSPIRLAKSVSQGGDDQHPYSGGHHGCQPIDQHHGMRLVGLDFQFCENGPELVDDLAVSVPVLPSGQGLVNQRHRHFFGRGADRLSFGEHRYRPANVLQFPSIQMGSVDERLLVLGWGSHDPNFRRRSPDLPTLSPIHRFHVIQPPSWTVQPCGSRE